VASVFGIAIGSNGSTLLAVAPYNRPRLSLNAGASWSDITYFSGSEVPIGCAVGSDNQTMLIADPDNGTLYMSLNGSADWSIVPGPAEGVWPGVCGVGIAGDNQTMVLCCYGGRCYITHDRWLSYSQIRPIGDMSANWRCISISANGLVILVGEDGGRLYLSVDGGDTDNWPETQPAGDSSESWTGTAIGVDNETLMACDSLGGGTLFRSSSVGDNWFVESINPSYQSFSAIALGGAALHAVTACDVGYGDSHVYIGAYTAPPPPEPPGPPVYPVIDKLMLDAYYAEVDIDEVEILGLPIESDFIDINS
jgi:hypothetical protein